MELSQRVIVGLSGGVDSAVAALLLKQQGYEVHALFMKNWEEDDTQQYCSAEKDLKDAQAICDKLAIPLHTVNFSSEYWETVFTNFLQEYQLGRTPNPDVLCNREIKFKVFLEHALRLGGQVIATGHYARIEQFEGKYQLLKGLDAGKDQSYFLYLVGQHQLAHSCFPIGHLEKSIVRELAAKAKLPNHAKKDSTGICFIGERPFRTFLSRFLPAQPGPIKTPDGKYLGQHEGVMYYTLGQRKGLHIGGQVDGTGNPWYVAAKDVPNNCLIVVQGHDHPLLLSRTVQVTQLHWITEIEPTLPYRCQAKTRYRQTDQACTIKTADDSYLVEFDLPQWAVTPGQSIVFYQGMICLGGGIIESAH